MRHRHRGFLMRAGEEFGFFVAAVIDQGFVQAADAVRRIARHVVDIERFDDIDHKVGGGRAFGLHRYAWRSGFGRGDRGGRPQR
jgi:hypothetical protein